MERVRFGNFMVHFDTEDHTLGFIVYPVVEVFDKNGSHFEYVDMSTSYEPLDGFDEEKASYRFKGSFCWRGIWEGRIYFADDEFWGEELKEMSDLYENSIVPWCKDFIKKHEPDGCYVE